MGINAMELQRETQFADAVISAAEAKKMAIISEAQQKSGAVLQQAKKACALADERAITAKYARKAAAEEALLAADTRREVLRYRTGLVEVLFGDVEQKLKAFAKSKRYADFLLEKAQKHAPKGGKAAGITLLVRPQDLEAHQKALLAALPGAAVQADESIRLGGLKLGDGKVLHDETLDAALEEEKRRFFGSGVLRIRL